MHSTVKATIPATFDVKVVGLTFVARYPDNVYELERQATDGAKFDLELVREPSNPHDPNAIVVQVYADMERLGHLPRDVAARIAPEMDAGVPWRVGDWQVLVAFGHEGNPGLTLTLNREA